jgi:hypothetical protein
VVSSIVSSILSKASTYPAVPPAASNTTTPYLPEFTGAAGANKPIVAFIAGAMAIAAMA